MRTIGASALFAAAAYFAGTQRYIQYFPGAPQNSLYCLAGLSSVGVMGSGVIFSDQTSNQRRRICIAVSLVLSSLATYYGFKKTIPLKTSFRFAAVEAVIMVAAEVITSESLQGRIVEIKEGFSSNLTKNHSIRTFGTPVLFAVMAYFAGTQRYIQFFPGATRNSLLCAAGLSSVGVLGSGMLLSDPASNQSRQICILAGLVLSSLATYYGFKKTIPLKTSLHFVAAEAIIMVAAEVITSESLQSPIAEAKESFSRNLTKNHSIRTFGTPVLFAAMAYFAGTQRYIQFFPGATRNSLLCAAGLSGVGVMGSGMLLSDPTSNQSRQICILAGLVLSSLATYYGFKKTIPLKASLRFVAAEAVIVVAAEVITSETLQIPIANAREKFLRNRAHSHAARTFAPPVLFVVAALFASMQRTIHYFPGATRNSLLCAAGLGGAGVVGSGMMLSDQESDRRRRICIAVGLVFSSLATYYGFKKVPSLQASCRFAAVETIIVVAAEALTSGGPKFPTTRLKSSLNRAVLSIIVPEDNPPPPNVAMTFCVDTSRSMTGENREHDVKEGISGVLDSAAEVAQTIHAKIKVAIVGFSSDATTICDPVSITNQTVQHVKGSVEDYTSGGGTNLYKGLIKAVEKVERMRSDALTHTLIVLTDGEVTIDPQQVHEIHGRLSAAKAQLFAVGIGGSHNKGTLQQLAPETGSFRGTYIDTTQHGQSIVGAISAIYEQTIAVFSQLELRTSQLGAGEWSVDGQVSKQSGPYSVCLLGSRSEEKQEETAIKIHSKALSSRFDLSDLSFELAFHDPDGKKGIINIPWEANTVIDPSILAHGR